MAGHLFVLDHAVIALEMLGDGIAQVHFLAGRENIFALRNRRKGGRLALLLRLERQHAQTATKQQQQADAKP